jgi:hypothetical protein
MPARDTIQGYRVGYRPLPPDQQAAETARYEVQVAGRPNAGIVARYIDTSHRGGQIRRTPRWRAILPGGDVLDQRCTARREATGLLVGRQRHDALKQHMDDVHLIRYGIPTDMARMLADHARERLRSPSGQECDDAV